MSLCDFDSLKNSHWYTCIWTNILSHYKMEIQIWVIKIGCKVLWISVSEATWKRKVYRKQMEIWVIIRTLDAVLMERQWFICMYKICRNVKILSTFPWVSYSKSSNDMKYAILIRLERGAQMYGMHQCRKGEIVWKYVKGKQTPSQKHCVFSSQ